MRGSANACVDVLEEALNLVGPPSVRALVDGNVKSRAGLKQLEHGLRGRREGGGLGHWRYNLSGTITTTSGASFRRHRSRPRVCVSVKLPPPYRQTSDAGKLTAGLEPRLSPYQSSDRAPGLTNRSLSPSNAKSQESRGTPL